MTVNVLGEQDPRKQGLKPGADKTIRDLQIASESKIQENKDWNGSGIWSYLSLLHSESKIQENKDWNFTDWPPGNALSYPTRRARSKKTRIETSLKATPTLSSMNLGEQDPRKQGLKPATNATSGLSEVLGEQDPRKQGLKLGTIWTLPSAFHSRRARSKKTRIETFFSKHLIEVKYIITSESKIQENKDWNTITTTR